MKKYFFILPIIWFSFCASISAQTINPPPSPTPPPVEDKGAVVININLIQVDATVTDKNGKIVTDLTSDDFEIYENGEKQSITNFSFVELRAPKQLDSLAQKPKADKNALPLPSVPVKLRPEQVRRTIALVVDDLGLSFSSTRWVQSALKKFVDEQMQPGDLVAVIRTGSGMGALQQFTNDKQMLYLAIEQIKFNLNGRVGISSFEPIKPTFKEDLNATMNMFTGETGDALGTEDDRKFDIGLDQFREDGFAVGTLGAVNYVVRGIGELPGRKAVMLFSEGFSSGKFGAISSRVEADIRTLIDLSNRSNVVIYTLDPRGLVAPGAQAADEIVGMRDLLNVTTAKLAERESDLLSSQQSLLYLAEETGGFAFINQNNINKGIERVLDEQNGYYLLGYLPDEETFDPKTKRFNKLEVRLKRPGLKIRHRSGFFGVTDAVAKASPKNSQSQILKALTSPFAKSEINLKLTTYFVDKPKIGPSMETFIHVKADDLKFIEEKNGWHKFSFEVLAVIFGENGAIIDMFNRSETIRSKAEAYEEIRRKGLVYSLAIPVVTPGAYQMRFVLQDTETAKIGSASQFIQVPNLKKKRLTISGIALQKFQAASAENKKVSSQLQTDEQRDIALRKFEPGTALQFIFDIYNAKAANAQDLTTQFRFFRGEREIFSSGESPLNLANESSQSLNAGGVFTLDKNMSPGDYVLQVIVKNKKSQLASQWIDFEVVK